MQWSDIPRNPSRSTLRQFAGLSLLFFGAGAWRCAAAGRPELAWALGALALGLGLPGLAHPPSVRWVFVGWLMAVFPVGFLVSHAVLAALFYCVFTPLAVFFQLKGRDALSLRRAPAADTYWRPKPAAEDPARYLQPF